MHTPTISLKQIERWFTLPIWAYVPWWWRPVIPLRLDQDHQGHPVTSRAQGGSVRSS